MEKTLFRNALLVMPTCIVPGEVSVESGRITAVAVNGALDKNADGMEIDVGGRYLAPGFIDIHTHGAGGADFMDGNLDAVYAACRAHLMHGATTVLPTTITSTRESLMDFVELFNRVEQCRSGMPEILGLHLEGPYFADSQRGAQDPRYLRPPQPDEYEEVVKRTNRVVRWSFAIELEGGDRFLRFLRDNNIVASLAHSDATCQEVMQAYAGGMKALTHFYSAMATVRRVNAFRVAGAIEAGYLIDGLYLEVIADGKHLPAELLQLIYKVKGPSRICLVSDSMRAAGMPDGAYKLGSLDNGMDCFVEDGVAKMPDRTAFAGSVATADRLVRTMHRLSGAPLHEAVAMMTLTPASLLGIESRKGTLAVGKDADLVVFDGNVNVGVVMARGEIVKNER